ncbi:group 3 secretory phospholipase A2 [Aulostomus maculatus]
MTRLAPLLLAVTLALLPGRTAAEAPVRCAWTKVLPDGTLHYSFLRRDPRPRSAPPRLYHSAWSRERALLGCTWTDGSALIRNYESQCRERTREFRHYPGQSWDLDRMLRGGDTCVRLAHGGLAERSRPVRSVVGPPEGHQGHDERSKVKNHRRVKRGFIVPGTLWCGSGNKAPSYADLGVFSDTDSCCREHDQCKDTILSFQSQFGVFNSNIFTLSHCDCDNRFRRCLKEANDSIADVVGYTFFNLLKMHCFEFSHRLQCTQRNWFGMCKETQMALYAEVHPPTLYESTNPTSEHNSTASFTSTTTEDPHLPSLTAAASTAPTPSTNTSDVTTSTGTHTPASPKNRSEQTADITDQQLSCGVYKDLDECQDKILPLQQRYGLHNPEPRPLYHCNCTARLFQTLAKQRQLSEAQSLLLGLVSSSCFLPRGCAAGQTCNSPAVVVKAKFPPLRLGADVGEQRHLQAVQLKVRRAQRKGRAVRLHKLCLRVVAPKPKKARKHNQDTHELPHMGPEVSRAGSPEEDLLIEPSLKAAAVEEPTGSPPPTGQKLGYGEKVGSGNMARSPWINFPAETPWRVAT